MYSRKKVQPRIEPWGTQALTLDVLVRTSHPESPEAVYYWEKEEIRPNIWPEIP